MAEEKTQNGQDKTAEKLSRIERMIAELAALRGKSPAAEAFENRLRPGSKDLRAGEFDFGAILEKIDQRLFLKDRKSVYRWINESFAREMKISREQIIGKSDYDIFPRELALKYTSDDRRIMETGKPEHRDERVSLGGRELFVHTLRTPVRDERGEVTGVLGTCWDIAEQKQTEEEWAKYRMQLEELLSRRTAELQTLREQRKGELPLDPAAEKGPGQNKGRFRIVLGDSGRALVLTEEEASGATPDAEGSGPFYNSGREGGPGFTLFLGQEEAEKLRQLCSMAGGGLNGMGGSFVGRFFDNDGNRRYLAVKISEISEPGKSSDWLADLSNSERTQELLRALEKKYQLFLENSREAILVLQDGVSRFINSKIVEMSGYSKKELSAFGFLDLIHPEDKERVTFLFKNASRGEASRFFHCRIICRDGGIRWLENRLAAIQWEGRPALVNYMADITDRKKAEEEMSRSLEPFRGVLQAMEKIIWGLNREYTGGAKEFPRSTI